MSPLSIFSVRLIVCLATSGQALKCNEGFNMTFGGIPLYHWMERTCADNSKCFGQELEVSTGVPLPVVMRYGACLSSSYATYLDCNTLFGPKSTFDPAKLLKMIPDLSKRVNDTIQDFLKDIMTQFRILLSNGKGTMEFINGIFMFCENLGFDMATAVPLKQPLAKLLRDLFGGNNELIQQRVVEILNAIGNLDTANQEFTDAIYNLIKNIDPTEQTLTQVKESRNLKALIERLPGLVRSMLTDSMSPAQWYDVAFKLLNNLNVTNPKKTAEDMVATVKATYMFPDNLKPYTDPFFDRFPDLVDQLAKGNSDSAGNWSLGYLKEISEVNAATTSFSDALINFIQNITHQDLQYEFRMTIKWMPGLLYKSFPYDKFKIGEAYITIADGLKTFNFNEITDVAQPTALSDLLMNILKISSNNNMTRAYIINFSKMFYNLLSDYSTEVEKFFSILDGLPTWPNIQAGKLLRDLIVGMGGTVPVEVEPFLTNLQPIFAAVVSSTGLSGVNATGLFDAMMKMVDAYKIAYPDSEFPEIAGNYVNYTEQLIEFDRSSYGYEYATAYEDYNNIMLELQLLHIDLQFAIMNSFNYSKDEFIQMIIKAFPAYETYMKLMRAMKPEDIKQLFRDIITWISSGPYTSEGFVAAIQPTVKRITASINDFLGDLRNIFHPDSCKYLSCGTDLCNTHVNIDSQVPVTKPAPRQTTPKPTTDGQSDWCEHAQCAPKNSYCMNDVNKLAAVCKCKKHFEGDPRVRCQAYCKQQTVGNRNLQFNYAFEGATAFSTQQCTVDGHSRPLASAVCVSQDGKDGKLVSKFENIVVVSCNLTISDVTVKIDKTATNVSTKELEDLSANLQVLTSGKVEEEGLKKVAQYMENVATIAEKNNNSVTQKVLVGMVNTVNNLIESGSITVEKAPTQPVTQSPSQTEKPTEFSVLNEKEIKQKILKSLTALAEQVQIPNGTKEIVIETPSIVQKVMNEEKSPTGKWEDVSFEPFLATGDTKSGNMTNFKKPLSIKIPGSVIDNANAGGDKIRISFILHKGASLFPSETKSHPGMIIAASLGERFELKDLEGRIAYHYTELDSRPQITKLTMFENNVVSHECAFWDFDLADWSTEGCCLDPHNLTKCLCDHLTNFALLVSDEPIPASVPLETMSTVGLILSMIGLVLTIVIHCLKEEVRKRRPTQILIHICCCLIFSYLVFLLGIDRTDNNTTCVTIAAVLQFFLLASWCWMTVYAYDMYRAFVLVFNTSKTLYMTKCTIFGYGVPLLIAILDAAVTVGYVDSNKKPKGVCDSEIGYDHLHDKIPIESSYISGNLCWLQGYSLYIGFLLPVGLMLVFNLFVYVMVLKILSQRKNTVKSSAKKTGMKDNFLISITLSASTGLTWAIGYIMLFSDDETYLLVTSWIFALLNVIQGVAIFITTCVRHENMRKIWLIPLTRCFSRCCTRISVLSPRRQVFEIQRSTDASSSASSSANNGTTKYTRSTYTSSKEFSESAI